MTQIVNVYCDESCHLQNDQQKVMVVGAVWCPLDKTKEISIRIREIKQKHGLSPNFELKWVKVSPAKKDFYLDLIDYFFDNENLHFRALIVPDKTLLDHDAFPNQNHDNWYYKMYFDMLKVILRPENHYRIYLDLKDTQGAKKVEKLREILCNNMYDFSRKIIERLQLVHSDGIEQLQLADLLIGAISYVNRELNANKGKIAIVDRIRKRSNYSLTKTTLLKEEKLNLFRWHATEI